MQQYQFEKIYSQMKKEFGKIRHGEEDFHSMTLFPIEGNLLKTHRQNPASNSRRLREAIALALFDIKSYYTGEEISVDKFRDENNQKLEHAILMAFDPFTNEELRITLTEQTEIDLADRTILHDYYKEPIICLLRIKESVDTWEKQMGANGYFDFLENYMGHEIRGDKMEFSVMLPAKDMD